MSQRIVFYEVKMKHVPGTSLFTMHQRMHAQEPFELTFSPRIRTFLHFMQAKVQLFKKNINFTCITGTQYAQTRGKIKGFVAKSQFYLGKNMIFDPFRQGKPDLAGERKAQPR